MASRLVNRLGSPRLAIFGMGLLAIGATLSYGNPVATPIWVLIAPLGLLALNLGAAITTNPRIYRRGGLLVFHVGLLAVVVLAAVGRLTYFEARVELLEGTRLNEDDLFDVRSGIWHSRHLADAAFVQGSYSVEYFPGLLRGRTYSHVLVPTDNGAMDPEVIGDDRPLVREGYRFYTTFNKGFAPVLTWVPAQGQAVTGAVHMPSYPLFAHKQDQTWAPPQGPELKLWLRLDTGLDEKAAWVLDGRTAKGVLVVNDGGQRAELNVGDSLPLAGGTLRYERLVTWMGYKIFYDPTLFPLFLAAVASTLGLFWHFWRKFGTQQPVRDVRTQSPAAPHTGAASAALRS